MQVRALVLAAALGLVGARGLEAQSVAYIDSQAVLAAAPGIAEAETEFNRLRDEFGAELDRMRADLETQISTYQQQQATLLPNVRTAREDAIRAAETRYQARLEEVEAQMATSQTRLIQPIIDQMTDLIEAIRAEGGYSLIFDTAGQSIVAADPALDLTQRVITRIQAGGTGAPASSGSAPVAPGSTP